MFNRICTVAVFGWRDLWLRGAGLAFAMVWLLVLVAPTYVTHTMSSDIGRFVSKLHQLSMTIGVGFAVYLGAGSIDREVTQRSLCAVLIRPIQRWEYLLGRALAVGSMYSAFIVVCSVSSAVICLLFDTELPADLGWASATGWVSGITWTVIAVALGAISSFSRAMAMIVAAIFVNWLSGLTTADSSALLRFIKAVTFYASKTEIPEAFSNLAALSLLENLLYAGAFFTAAAWYFTQRDVRLKD